MSVRTTVILAILVAILGGYYLWSERQPKPDTGSPRLFPFDKSAVQEVTITRDATTLALKRDGDGWRMTQPVEARADRGPVASLVSSLTLARIERMVEEKATNLADFGLDPPTVRIGLKVKDKAEPVILLLGKNTPTGSWAYAKQGDSPAVLILSATLKDDLQKTPTDFRDKTILAFDPTKTTRVELRSKDGTIVAAKAGEEWRLEQPIQTRADSFAIERLLSVVRDLKAKEFVAEGTRDIAKYGLSRPDIRVTISERDAAASKTVLIARRGGGASQGVEEAPPGGEKGEAYIALEGGRQVFLVDGKILEDLRKSPLDLRAKRLLAVETKAVKEIRIVWPNATIALERDGDTWTLKEPQAAPAESGKALDLLSTVTGLQFKGIATQRPGDLAKYGLAKPQAEVIVKKTDNTDLSPIELGKVDKDNNQLFAKLKNSPIIYILDPRVLDDLPRDPAKLKKAGPGGKTP